MSSTALRAGVPKAIKAAIGSRSRIVRTVSPHAVGDVIATAGHNLHDRPADIVVAVAVIGAVTVIVGTIIGTATAVVGTASVVIGLGGDRTADYSTRNGARNKAATAGVMITAATVVTAAIGVAPAASVAAASTTEGAAANSASTRDTGP